MNDSACDAELVVRTLKGDKPAYVALVCRYERTARVVAMRVLQDHSSVEDAVQQAFLTGFQKLNTLRVPERFGAWILKIVKREAQSIRRSWRHHLTWNPGHEPEARDTPYDDEIRQLIVMLNRLPEHERIVVVLHHMDGRSTPEISMMLSRPIGTVTKQLSRGIRRLQRWAGRSGQDHSRKESEQNHERKEIN